MNMPESAIEASQSERLYSNWAVYRATQGRTGQRIDGDKILGWLDSLGAHGAYLEGAYNLRGFRGDCELMLWLTASDATKIQSALGDFAGLVHGQFEPHWSGMGVHRPAEFSRDHVPAYLSAAGHRSRGWICVYPFNRSYEWYLLPAEERKALLAEHGRAGQKYAQVASNTVAAFGLGDYEWLLALEADELTDLVDVLRDMRYTNARRHVRDEVPFFTGRLFDLPRINEYFLMPENKNGAQIA